MPPLTDAQAKQILLQWPSASPGFFGGSNPQPWIQAQPKNPNRRATAPYLSLAGSSQLVTRPDGMWLRMYPTEQCADVVVVEVCGSLQNFFDKRSRFSPSTNSLVIHVLLAWLREAIGTAPNARQSRWQKSGAFSSQPQNNLILSVRTMSVLFALKQGDYNIVKSHGLAAGHEFFVRHSSLTGHTAPLFRSFLARIAQENRFYT